ncbi:MAG TPA: hypothetical protein VKP30_20705 [Polyangiaceae bacterium]|nr:hypothetical protein [Polyangiaceae bacterium]
MPNPFEILAEARIRDWQRRKDRGELPSTVPDAPGESLELQLLHQITELIARIPHAEPAEQVRLERESRNLEIRLMVTLEGNGLPLAARRIAAELESIRARHRP